MATVTASSQDSLLYEFDRRVLKSVVELEMPGLKKFMAMAETAKVTQKGRAQTIEHDVRTIIKAGASNMDYPDGTIFKNARYHVVPTDMAMSYEIDRATFEDYQNGGKDTLTTIGRELKNIAKAFGERREFTLYGDGTGKLCTLLTEISGTVGAASITPDGTHAKAYGISQLKEGVPYDWYLAAGTLGAAGLLIDEAGLDHTNNRFTLTTNPASSMATGDFLVPGGSYNQMPRGLAYLVQGAKTGFWQGLDVTGLSQFNSMYTDASGQEISNSLIEKTLQKSGFRNGSGINPSLRIWTSPSQISNAKAGTWNLFRLSTGKDNDSVATSVKNIRYEDSVFESRPKCDADRMYFLDMGNEAFVRLLQTEVGLLNPDGLKFRQKTGSNDNGKGEFFLNYGCADNFACDNPEKQALLANLSVPSDIAAIWNFRNSS